MGGYITSFSARLENEIASPIILRLVIYDLYTVWVGNPITVKAQ